MRIMMITQGEYGRRILAHVRAHAPAEWTVDEWVAPAVLPPIVDDPAEFISEELAPADLLVFLGEHPGTAQLLPELAKVTGARSVLAAVDNEAWLPSGLRTQLAGWLRADGVDVVYARPLCSLGAKTTGYGPELDPYDDPRVRAFTRYFGQPEFRITCEGKDIQSIELVRDAACGCARFIAGELLGVDADEAEQAAGLLHHHFPCLAAMGMDPVLNDTLMHISGRIVKEAIEAEVADVKTPVRYSVPEGFTGE
jgi:thymidylate synthase